MVNIMQFDLVYISRSNCLVTVEIELGSVPVSETCRRRRGLERTMAATALYVRCSSRAASSLGMSSITSCPHASSSCHQRRSPALA
jgi:hypothetical protein